MAKGTSLKQFIEFFFREVDRTPISPQQRAAAEEFFHELQADMINAIIKTEVSQELINKTSPSSILGTPGSLYGFLGFVEGFEPVEEIIKVVKEKMSYRVSRRLLRGGLKLTVTLPTLEDFRTPDLILPWEGGYSTVDAIEKGLSGLPHYLKAKNIAHSRSSEGIQSKSTTKSGEYQKRGWITPILQDVINKSKSFR